MSEPLDNAPASEEAPDGEAAYTETVVEYVGNRRLRAVLGIILVLAFLALLGLGYAVLSLTRGAAEPEETAIPSGMEWVRSIYGWGNEPDEALFAPTDVDIAPNGTIWVVTGHDTLAGFNPDGSVDKVIKPEGVASMETIAVAENGDLYVADYGGQILQFSSDGEPLDKWSVQLPQGVDVTDGSQIAVSSNAGVAVFTPDGQILAQWGTRGSGEDQFDLPHAILIGEDGRLFVADTQNRRVRAFTPQGRLIWSTGITPDRSQEGSGDFRNPENTQGPFSIPSGLAFNGKGQIAVVDPFKFTITVLDPESGEIVKLTGANGEPGRQAVFGDFGQADGLFAYPTGIAYDQARDWFAVADTANNRVQILRLPESGGSPVAPVIAAFRLPMLIFFVPLLLLLLAIILAILRRRKKRQLEGDGGSLNPSPEAG